MQVLYGDDIGYSRSLLDFEGKSWGYLRYMAYHFFYSNGRIANLLAPFWLSVVPRWILDAVNGVSCFVFYGMTLILSGIGGRHTATAKIVVTSLLLLTMPWWDSFMLYDVMFNYVWSSALVLTVLWLMHHDPGRRWRWLAWLLAAFAAAMHEGLGLPVSAGLCVWLLLSGRWKRLSVTQRGMIVAFFAGTLVVMSSPGIWRRFVSEGLMVGDRIPNDVVWVLLLKSDFYTLGLLAVIAVMAVCDMARLKELVRTPWIVYVTASLAGAFLSATSGIVGRSGWFASVMTLIAMVQWVRKSGWHVGRIVGMVVSAVLSVVIIVHIVAVDVVQSRLSRELVKALEAYSLHPDEPVYMDYQPWDTLQWLTLAKVRGVPEPYETYTLTQYASRYASNDADVMVVLPTEAEDMECTEMTPAGRGYVTPVLPELDHPGATTFIIDGRHYIPVKYRDKKKRRMYYLAPLNLRNGDRMQYLPAIEP